MATRSAAPLGAPIWIILQTTDVERARGFYGELFGWKGEEADEQFGGYFEFAHDASPVAGCAPPPDGATSEWTMYLAVADASATAAAAAAHGGEVLFAPMAIKDFGTMTIVTDPGGSRVGAWQPGAHVGYLTYDVPGTPGWFNLETRAFARTLAFYEDVFAWSTRALGDTDEFRYSALVVGDEMLAGIHDYEANLDAGAPTAWTVVFRVEDTDASVASSIRLGGSVRRVAHDSPYGRLATLADPTGAEFALISGG